MQEQLCDEQRDWKWLALLSNRSVNVCAALLRTASMESSIVLDA